MEVLPDPLALVEHRQSVNLLVERRVLDGDPRMEREHLHESLVVGGELRCVALVGQVEVAHRTALDDDRHTEERMHRRMGRRKPIAVRVCRDLRDPVRAGLADDQAEQPPSARDGSDLESLLAAHARRDEAGDLALIVDRSKGRVLRTHEVAHAVDDRLEHEVDVEDTGDRATRLVQRCHPFVGGRERRSKLVDF